MRTLYKSIRSEGSWFTVDLPVIIGVSVQTAQRLVVAEPWLHSPAGALPG